MTKDSTPRRIVAQPEHFFSHEGKLFDTRRKDWARNPVRSIYCQHFRVIKTGSELRACLRAGAFAWPGGYECFFITSDGAILSFEAVRAELRQVLEAIRDGSRYSTGWHVVGLDCCANTDGPIICDHTNRVIMQGPDGETD